MDTDIGDIEKKAAATATTYAAISEKLKVDRRESVGFQQLFMKMASHSNAHARCIRKTIRRRRGNATDRNNNDDDEQSDLEVLVHFSGTLTLTDAVRMGKTASGALREAVRARIRVLRSEDDNEWADFLSLFDGYLEFETKTWEYLTTRTDAARTDMDKAFLDTEIEFFLDAE